MLQLRITHMIPNTWNENKKENALQFYTTLYINIAARNKNEFYVSVSAHHGDIYIDVLIEDKHSVKQFIIEQLGEYLPYSSFESEQYSESSFNKFKDIFERKRGIVLDKRFFQQLHSVTNDYYE